MNQLLLGVRSVKVARAAVVTAAWAVVLAVAGAVAQDGEQAERNRRIPRVYLSAQHQELVELEVGDAFPEATLPAATAPEDEGQPLDSYLGRRATVVVVWHRDRGMTRALMRDLEADIRQRYAAEDGDEEATDEPPAIATVAIASNVPAPQSVELAGELGYQGALLLDAEAKLMEKLGAERDPQVYVLDAQREVVWFDVEYSLSTRRELRRTVAQLAKQQPAEQADEDNDEAEAEEDAGQSQ